MVRRGDQTGTIASAGQLWRWQGQGLHENLDPVGYLMSDAAALKSAPTRLGTQGVNCPKAVPNLTKL
jgi:hypothetical protein